jgi:Plasmid pRiA4b ORF-3-like protein
MISLLEGRGSRIKKPPTQALVLTLNVLGCQPRIWRRLVVRETMWLARLHDSIQVAFDWFDYQTHTFTVGEQRLGNPAKTDTLLVADDRDITLLDIELAKRGAMLYEYHFGEGWRVEVRVEAVRPVVKGEVYPQCLAGERAGPPEDCGGVEAYQDMLACIQEPNTDLGREWLEWLGPTHDVDKLDIVLLNKVLRKFSK